MSKETKKARIEVIVTNEKGEKTTQVFRGAKDEIEFLLGEFGICRKEETELLSK